MSNTVTQPCTEGCMCGKKWRGPTWTLLESRAGHGSYNLPRHLPSLLSSPMTSETVSIDCMRCRIDAHFDSRRSTERVTCHTELLVTSVLECMSVSPATVAVILCARYTREMRHWLHCRVDAHSDAGRSAEWSAWLVKLSCWVSR